MKSEMHEYSPAPEHRKIFNLTPAADDVTLTAIRARTDCLRDRNINYGARVLFCFLLDLALNPYVHIAKGIVAISAAKLTEHLGCYEKSIFPWILELETGRHLWKDKQFMPNFWAMNRYHITAFDVQGAPSQLPTRDGMWGNGVRRPIAPRGGFGGGSVLKTTRQIADENSHLIENQPAGGGKSTREPSPEPPVRAVENPPDSRVENPPVGEVENPPASPVEKPHGARVKKAIVGRGENQTLKRVSVKVRESLKGEGNPPQNDFAAKIKGLYPSRLQKLASEIGKELRKANSPSAQAEWKRRLKLVKEEILGGPVEDDPTPQPKPARKAPTPPPPPTHEELLAGARYLVECGKEYALTADQRAALKAAGKGASV